MCLGQRPATDSIWLSILLLAPSISQVQSQLKTRTNSKRELREKCAGVEPRSVAAWGIGGGVCGHGSTRLLAAVPVRRTREPLSIKRSTPANISC